ncbi:hypothetical protein [Robiginitalea sp. SC105]|uniref:hypothetical protein n=1 Tax=Robiginitalea sp. SC105 TaxID=2762332 RepID=UPI001639C3A7|nr:hypothetical protein [Robiginitalea sp. SC105]MBC2838150.1 hypothetical protein [Robiginitalea sp. SC105]
MLKRFRKIRQKLLSEGNTGKYLKYAIGEVILVMIGILLALQVNNWNTERIERKKESDYLDHIHKEFLLNRAQLDTVVAYHFTVYNNATKILDIPPGDIASANKDSLSFYISQTFHNYTFNPHQSTVNSLTNTSSFEILTNLELRELLQNWDELVKDYKEEEMISRDYSFDEYFPYFGKHISYLSFSNNTNIFNSKTDDAFLSSLEFQNAIAFKREVVKDIIFKSELKVVSETIDRILELTQPDEKK